MSRGRVYLLSLLLAAVPGAAADGETFAPKPGEVLVYRIYLAGIALGRQRIEVRAGKAEGRELLYLDVTLDSTRSLFGLADYHERRSILWDPAEARPLAEEATVTQRNVVQTERLSFDSSEGLIRILRTPADGTARTETAPYVENTQTNCSLLTYLRTFPWEKGRTDIPLLTGSSVASYGFTVVAETRPIRVPYGTFTRSYHVFNRELRYDIWFDRGPGHLPLEVRNRTNLGLASMKLVEAAGYK